MTETLALPLDYEPEASAPLTLVPDPGPSQCLV